MQNEKTQLGYKCVSTAAFYAEHGKDQLWTE